MRSIHIALVSWQLWQLKTALPPTPPTLLISNPVVSVQFMPCRGLVTKPLPNLESLPILIVEPYSHSQADLISHCLYGVAETLG